MQILQTIEPLIVVGVVGIAAIITQRKFGRKGLLIVWLASAAIWTGFYVTRFYFASSLSTREALYGAAYLSILLSPLFVIVFGMLVWLVTAIVSPPKHTSTTEMNYFPLPMPTEELEDMHGLPSIPRRYQELLATYATALDAVPINPYMPLSRIFSASNLRTSFRLFLPSYIRQSGELTRQMNRIPNTLTRGLIGAERVLAELDQMTTAELSTIEECHRINLRRTKHYLLLSRDGWLGKIPALIGVLITVIKNFDKVELLKRVNLHKFLSTVSGASVLEAIWPMVGGIILGVIITHFRYRERLRRLQAFDDILAIAKAYRKGYGETKSS